MRIIQIIIVNDQMLNLSPSFFSILSTFCSSSKICSVCLFNSLFVTTSSVETYTLTATSEKNEGICQRQYNPARYIDPTTTLIALTIEVCLISISIWHFLLLSVLSEINYTTLQLWQMY